MYLTQNLRYLLEDTRRGVIAQFKVSKLFILCSCIHVIVVSCQLGPQPVDTWFGNVNNVPKTAVIEVYGQDVFAGPKQTDYEIARSSITSTSPTSFGQLFMADDLLTVGPDPNSQVVGRAQGLIGYADLNEPAFYLSGNFLFQGGSYNGSVISVLGRDPLLSKARELSIVGGTGAFRLARGIVVATTYMNINATGYAIFKYTLYVTYV